MNTKILLCLFWAGIALNAQDTSSERAFKIPYYDDASYDLTYRSQYIGLCGFTLIVGFVCYKIYRIMHSSIEQYFCPHKKMSRQDIQALKHMRSCLIHDRDAREQGKLWGLKLPTFKPKCSPELAMLLVCLQQELLALDQLSKEDSTALYRLHDLYDESIDSLGKLVDSLPLVNLNN